MDRAIELLEEQQRKVKERSAPWLVAEQLKDMTPSCGSSTVLAPLGTRPRKAALRRSSIWRISCEVRYGQRLEESRGEIAGRAPQ